MHPRPDGRHIVYNDIKIIKDLTSAANKELNIEGNPVEPSNQEYKGYINLINEFKPTQATLVPDDTNQITSYPQGSLSTRHPLPGFSNLQVL